MLGGSLFLSSKGCLIVREKNMLEIIAVVLISISVLALCAFIYAFSVMIEERTGKFWIGLVSFIGLGFLAILPEIVLLMLWNN